MLAESADIKTDAFRDLYGAFGEDIVARCVAHHMHHAGLSRVLKIRKYHKEFLNQDLSDDELASWVQRYSDIVEQKVVKAPAVPGAVEFMSAVQGVLKLYVISGTPEDELQRIVKARKWDPCFDEVHGSPRLKPEIVNDIVVRNNLDKERILFVGDAMTDHDAARDTGVSFLARVAPHHDDIFPEGTKTVRDLVQLGEIIRTSF